MMLGKDRRSIGVVHNNNGDHDHAEGIEKHVASEEKRVLYHMNEEKKALMTLLI